MITRIFAQRLAAECGVSEQVRDFEQWLDKVESLSLDPGAVLATLLSDAAISAFEDGVAAADFALRLQARAA